MIEDLEKSQKKIKGRVANRKISRFSLREYIEHLEVLCGRSESVLFKVNPAHTGHSEE